MSDLKKVTTIAATRIPVDLADDVYSLARREHTTVAVLLHGCIKIMARLSSRQIQTIVSEVRAEQTGLSETPVVNVLENTGRIRDFGT